MSPHTKKPLSNLSNVVAAKKPAKQLKRGLDSPNSIANRKRKNFKKNQENQITSSQNKNESQKDDLTRTIECKIKNIVISDESCTTITAKKSSVPLKLTKLTVNEDKSTSAEQPWWIANYERPESLPFNVIDYDLTQLNYVDSEPHYAHEIFKYLGIKEQSMRTVKYMHKQKDVTDKMRTVLVDWLVEVQQNFELNHETLYLAVKFIDHYLMQSTISRADFQLLGLTAIFIACKFDERVFPSIEDFIYISDDAYCRNDFINMEIEMLKVLQFNLNFPLSYSFLRRYARCASVSIETLTLARYILETSLMEYCFIDEFDSKMAAASLLLALKMKNDKKWNETLVFYSGYTEKDLIILMWQLNKAISTPSKYVSVKNKYSDKVFYEVAKVNPLKQSPQG